jgi:hypothetical protein
LKQKKQIPPRSKVYSDGSAIDGGVGAAALLYKNRKVEKVAKKHLGSIDEHTVFEAELVGAVMEAMMLRWESRQTGATIGVDNQATI